MSRSSQGAVAAAGMRQGPLARPGHGRLLARAPRRPRRQQRRGQGRPHHRDPRPDRDRARSLLPRPALPGDRQRHRLPGQQRPDQPAVPGSQRRHDQGLDADPGPADQQPADLLQRLLRHPAAGPPGDPAPRPGHQPAPLRAAAAGLGQGALALSGADGQVQRQPEGGKGRHRRPHGADLGAGLLPGPDRQQRLARQPRTGHLQKRDGHPPGRAAGKGRPPRRPTAANTRRRACSTRRRWSRGARPAPTVAAVR